MKRRTRSIVEVSLYCGVALLAVLYFGAPAPDGPALAGRPAAANTEVLGAVGPPASVAAAEETIAGPPAAATEAAGPGALEIDPVVLFPKAPPARAVEPPRRGEPLPVDVSPQEADPATAPEQVIDTEALLREAARDAEPPPPPPEPAPWLSYVGMVVRDGELFHYFKNERTNRVLETSLERTVDGHRLVIRQDGTFILSRDGRSYVVGDRQCPFATDRAPETEGRS